MAGRTVRAKRGTFAAPSTHARRLPPFNTTKLSILDHDEKKSDKDVVSDAGKRLSPRA